MSLPHDAVGWSAVCDCDFKTKGKTSRFLASNVSLYDFFAFPKALHNKQIKEKTN